MWPLKRGEASRRQEMLELRCESKRKPGTCEKVREQEGMEGGAGVFKRGNSSVEAGRSMASDRRPM